jgi:hypothetical protein
MKAGSSKFTATKTLLVLSAVLCFLAFSIVFADGDSRLATKGEKDFTQSVLNVFAKSALSGPEGWDQTSDTTVIEELERVTTGAEQQPLQVEYCIAWQDTKRINEGQEKLNIELEKLAKGPAANITTKSIEELQKRVTPHDVKVRIDLQANILNYGIYEQINPAVAIAGGQVYQSPGKFDSNTGWREGSVYVFLGKNWKLSRDGGTYMNTTATKGVPHTVVQTILVKVQADPTRAQQIIQKIDWEALKKLIKN